jgi:hypothetical protein
VRRLKLILLKGGVGALAGAAGAGIVALVFPPLGAAIGIGTVVAAGGLEGFVASAVTALFD